MPLSASFGERTIGRQGSSPLASASYPNALIFRNAAQSDATPRPGRSGASALPSVIVIGCPIYRSDPNPCTSKYDRFGIAASRWTVRSCAPYRVTGRLNASARCATFMNTVMPPQFDTSGSGNVTPPVAIIWVNSCSVRRFSPVAIVTRSEVASCVLADSPLGHPSGRRVLPMVPA
jgi:hypothetical protein